VRTRRSRKATTHRTETSAAPRAATRKETTLTSIAPENLPLERLQHWERARADDVWLVQPGADGGGRRFTWRDAVEEARRVAAYL
ncbi:AMP-binding acetyl-CoA synthetase, partial [Burkholderia pseudomallei]